MRRLAAVVLVAACGAAAVLASQLAWSPPPIASATTAAGGVVGLALAARPPRARRILTGALLGWLVGVALHARSHVVEERVGGAAEFAGHLLVDGALGATIGGVGLAVGLLAAARLAPRP